MSNFAPTSDSQKSGQSDDEIDLLALLVTLWNGWKIILACAVLGLLLGFTYSRYVQPTYQSDALIQIDEQSKGLAALGSDISDLVGEGKSQAETERELINSRMVLEPVVHKLHLDILITDPSIDTLDRIAKSQIPTQINTEQGVSLATADGEVHIAAFKVPVAYQGKPFNLVKTNTGFALSTDINKQVLSYSGKLNEPVTIKTPEGDIVIHVTALPDNGRVIRLTNLSTPSAINRLNNNLAVAERGKQTGIVQLTLTGDDQQQVSRILSNVVQSYVDQNLTRGSQQTTTTIKFMESQIPELKKRLEQSEEDFNKFRENYGTIDVTKEAEILLSESAQLERQLSELNLKQSELLTYYTEEHPLVVQINNQLAVLKARRQEIKDTVSRLPEVQRQFLQLSQDVEINREIYLNMLKNYEQLKIAHAGEIGSIRVVDMPINTFNPIAPKKVIIWAISLILGTLFGSLLVLLRSLMRHTVKDPQRLELLTGVPVIATVPRSKLSWNLSKSKGFNRRLLATVDHNGLSYEAIKSLRTSLLLSMPKQNKISTLVELQEQPTDNLGRIILISGEAPGIGKSFIASNLAETFSQLNKKVLIVDGDMRRGELHKVFTDVQNIGLGDYLKAGGGQLNDYIHPTNFEFIDFMPRGVHPPNPASLLSSELFNQLVLQVARIYDYIIIDSPPILAVSDAAIIAQLADKVLMVARYNSSIEGQINYAIKQLNKSNTNVDGIVLNDVTHTSSDKYSYHYNYAYGNSKD